jgi:hypothetical protein
MKFAINTDFTKTGIQKIIKHLIILPFATAHYWGKDDHVPLIFILRTSNLRGNIYNLFNR